MNVSMTLNIKLYICQNQKGLTNGWRRLEIGHLQTKTCLPHTVSKGTVCEDNGTKVFRSRSKRKTPSLLSPPSRKDGVNAPSQNHRPTSPARTSRQISQANSLEHTARQEAQSLDDSHAASPLRQLEWIAGDLHSCFHFTNLEKNLKRLGQTDTMGLRRD